MELARSRRLLLRRVELSDRDEIVSMYEMGRSVERWGPPLKSGTTLEQLVENWVAEDPARHVRLVTERIDQERPRLANVLALTDIVRGFFNSAYIAWRTHPALLRQGYCTEAVALTLGFAFAETGLGLHRVQASILPDNAGSCRVAQKCGFRLEGVAQRYLYIREAWRDHLIFAITAEEHPRQWNPIAGVAREDCRT